MTTLSKLPNPDPIHAETTLTARKQKRAIPVIVGVFIIIILLILGIFLYKNVFIV